MSILQSRARARSRGKRGGRGGLLQGAVSMGARALRGRGGRPGARRGRGRGITATQLKGFRRVVNLLHKVGMQPKRLGRIHKARR